MRIIFKVNKKRKFESVLARNVRMFAISFYFFSILIDYGNKWRKKMTDEIQKELMNRKCLVCGLPLKVNSVYQHIKYHKECRHYRWHKKFDTTELQKQIKDIYHL